MCGIAGCYGRNSIIISLALTLGQLERGTMGTGVAWCEKGRVHIYKQPINPIMFISKNINKLPRYPIVAISHNRQPSVGKVSYVNTHPFMDCKKRFALIHNGSNRFVETFKKEINQKHRILGDTDSEIITHLLEQYYEEKNDMVEAIKMLMNTNVSGSILVLEKSGVLYGCRLGHEPLHYCTANKHVLLASTKEAIRNLLDNEKDEIKALPRYAIIIVKKGDVEIIETEKTKIYKEYDLDYNLDYEIYYGLVKQNVYKWWF